MDTLIMECCLPGCVSSNCIYRLPDTERTEQKGYNPAIPWSTVREPFTVVYVCPHCTKEAEREQYRIDVFAQANAAIESIDAAQYTSLRGIIKAEKDAWDPWARQWWDGPCPFYVSLGS